MNETDCQVKIPTEESKHIRMAESIAFIDTVVEHLENLYVKITEAPQEAVNKDSGGQTTLASILNYGPNEIREKCEDAHKKIEQIEGELF